MENIEEKIDLRSWGKSVSARKKNNQKSWDWLKWRLRQASARQNTDTCWRFLTPTGLWYRLRNCITSQTACAIAQTVSEPTMVKTFVKEDEPDKEKRKGRQGESTSQQSSNQQLRFDVFFKFYCDHWHTAPMILVLFPIILGHIFFSNVFPSVTALICSDLINVKKTKIMSTEEKKEYGLSVTSRFLA